MSLDVWLELAGFDDGIHTGIFVREGGQNKEISRAEWDEKFPGREPVVAYTDSDNEVYSANITHNLSRMAREAGIYMELWCPEESGITQANQLVGPLERGLALLKGDPDRFKAFNPDNGWGDYDGLVRFVGNYLDACKKYPGAKVWASR